MKTRGLLRHARGVVYAEFLVAFVPFFLLFLGGVQLALIAQARIIVQHAASMAVRAAVVSIDDDPVFYVDGKRKVLSPVGTGSGQKSSLTAVETLAKKKSQVKPKDEEKVGSGRLNMVRNAAYLPLSAIAPSPAQLYAWIGSSLSASDDASVERAVGTAPLQRVLTGLALYGRSAAGITFPRQRGSDELRDPNEPWSDTRAVHLRVTFLFPCGVPLVRGIVCNSLLGMQADNVTSRVENMFRNEPRPDPHKQALKELGQAEWPTAQKALYALWTERFIALRGEASLPNQGAAYRYPSELCKTRVKAPGVACEQKTCTGADCKELP